MEYWTEEGLSYLTSVVGVPLFADLATETRRRINYARVCMELDANKPMIDEFIIDVPVANDPDLVCDEITIKVSYQWKPPICSHCHIFGHSTVSCSLHHKDKEALPKGLSEHYKQASKSWIELGRKGKTSSSVQALASKAPVLDEAPDPSPTILQAEISLLPEDPPSAQHSDPSLSASVSLPSLEMMQTPTPPTTTPTPPADTHS